MQLVGRQVISRSDPGSAAPDRTAFVSKSL